MTVVEQVSEVTGLTDRQVRLVGAAAPALWLVGIAASVLRPVRWTLCVGLCAAATVGVVALTNLRDVEASR